MKYRLWGSLVMVTMLLGSSVIETLDTRAEEIEHVVINEVAWAGSTLSAQDEWVELFNPTMAPVDIGGWMLTKNTGTEELMLTVPAGALIPAGGFFVVSNFGPEASVLAIQPDLVDAAITLSNSALQLKLYKGSWADSANLVDIAGDGGVPPAGNNTAKLSMERDADGGAWHDAQTALNLDPDVTDKATPASPNSEVTFPPELSSISPSSGIAGEVFAIESIVGKNFNADIQVALRREARTIAAVGVEVANPELIDAGSFSLPEDSPGDWELVVTNPDGTQAILPNAVSITEPAPEFDMSPNLRINEVYPQPGTGSNDEYIELVNVGSQTVSLKGWQLDDVADSGSAPHVFDGGTVPPQGLFTIYKPSSHITLNDSGDTVRLLQPGGLVLDSTSYDASPRASSWARSISGFIWTTTPSPNGLNVFTQPEEPEETEVPIEEADDVLPSFEMGVIKVEELLPKPMEGEEEFIELRNTQQSAINLLNWSLVDAGGKRYKWASSQSLAGGMRLVIYGSASKINLNDSGGESIKLLDPSGGTISTLAYPDRAPTDSAFIALGESGTWVSNPTPGDANPEDMVEIESEVGGWVAADIAEGSLPVTGPHRKSLEGFLLVSCAILLIMGWRLWLQAKQ